MKVPISKQSNILVAMIVVVAGLIGSYHVSRSLAASYASVHPYGYFDSCTASGNNTILYGWAQDPDAPKGPQPTVRVKVGNLTSTVQTNIDGYREAVINDYIHRNYAGQPTPGEYGFKVTMTNLYKGNSYTVSGLALNYGAGAGQDTALGVYSAAFPGGKLPDSCLVTKPVTPTPPPPVVVDPGGGSGGSGDNGSSTDNNSDVGQYDNSGAVSDIPAVPAPASDANGTVDAGTTSASVLVPVGGASQVHITYGIDPNILDGATVDQATNGADTTVTIDGLQALTTYQYAIVRTGADGTVATSAVASFKTTGFTVSLHFIDGKKKAVAGIKGSIDDTKKTQASSDKGGTMIFKNLPNGSYIVTYSYQGKTQTHALDTNNAIGNVKDNGTGQNSTPQTAVLSETIDLSKVNAKVGGVGASQVGSSKAGLVISILIVLLLLGFGLWFWRRRRRNQNFALGSSVLPAPYNPATSNHDIIDQQMTQHFEVNRPAPIAAPLPEPQLVEPAQVAAPTAPTVSGAQPAHMGQSLREMVIKSMHEEAQKKKQSS